MKNKKPISILLITSILIYMAFSCTVFADDTASFDLLAERAAVKMGEEFVLTVKGINVKDLNAYEVNLTFDKDKLEYVKAESKIDGYSVVKNNDNSLIIANARMGNAVTFKGKKAGTSTIKLNSVKFWTAYLQKRVIP